VTNARIAALHGLSVGPLPARPCPFRSAKPRARHERQSFWPQQRRPSVCGSAAALRSVSVPAVSPPALHFFRSPTADRSLCRYFSTSHPALFGIPLQQLACAAKLPNRPASRQCFARVQVPNAQ